MKKYSWAQNFFLFLGAAALSASCQPKGPGKALKSSYYEEETYSDFFGEDAFDSTIITGEEISEEVDEMLFEEENPFTEGEELTERHLQAEEPPIFYKPHKGFSVEQTEENSPSTLEEPEMAENTGEGMEASPSFKSSVEI